MYFTTVKLLTIPRAHSCLKLSRNNLRRTLSTLIDTKGRPPPSDFALFSDFLSLREQRVLLFAALQKLDSTESRQFRRKRKALAASRPSDTGCSLAVENLFLPDEYYQFEQGHYDQVIKDYREMHVTSWPDDNPALASVLNRLHALCPPAGATQTHLIHLASHGEILPHIDNLGASGSWILGVSLGSARILRIEASEDNSDSFDVLLPSGSVYLQKDTVRFNCKHSILKEGVFAGQPVGCGQRVSMMIRDRLSSLPLTHHEAPPL